VRLAQRRGEAGFVGRRFKTELKFLFMAAIATTPLSKEELARRWNEIVKEFERVDVEGWTIETNQYGQILMSPLPEGVLCRQFLESAR
jgi:hypothetical protein